MRVLTLTMFGAALCAGAALGSLPAGAQGTASLSGCIKIADQVDHALAANPQSPNHEAAVRDELNGRGFCANGFYGHGVADYEQALKLLGVPNG
ncbi:MAG: hypothetical protein ACREHV_14875 [Rhizomicrobium sp.]